MTITLGIAFLSTFLVILGIFTWLVKKILFFQQRYEDLLTKTNKSNLDNLDAKIKSQDKSIDNLDNLRKEKQEKGNQTSHEISSASPEDLVAISNRDVIMLQDPFADDPGTDNPAFDDPNVSPGGTPEAKD